MVLMQEEHVVMMDLKRLSHLVALADERHFARAAERVHLSQPAFSRSIQALESAFGQRLFDRDTGEPRPTPAGAFLVERARRLLFDARCLQRDAELYAQSNFGDAALGAGPFPAATLMPRVLPELRRRHPNLRLRVEVGNWTQLLEQLGAERIEFFVADTRGLPLDATLDVQPVGRQQGAFFVRAGHALAGRPCTLEQMWAHGVASTKLPAPVKAALGQLLKVPPGQEPGFALECDDVPQLRAVALETDTVLGATRVALRDDLAAGRLVELQVTGLPPLYADMGVVSLRNRSPSPLARQAIQLIAEVAAVVNAGEPRETRKAPARRRKPA
jgi:DNA-binding transcriptional LysR family regulator